MLQYFFNKMNLYKYSTYFAVVFFAVFSATTHSNFASWECFGILRIWLGPARVAKNPIYLLSISQKHCWHYIGRLFRTSNFPVSKDEGILPKQE